MKPMCSIAVGGPAAGERLCGQYGHTRYVVPLRLPVSFSAMRACQIPEAVAVHHAYYRQMDLRYTNPKGKSETFQFWVHADTIRDQFDLIRELANGYRPVHIQPESEG